MRHDDSSNRPEDEDPPVDPPGEWSADPSAPEGELPAPEGELFVPGDGDVELLDQPDQDAPTPLMSEADEEMTPAEGEFQLFDSSQAGSAEFADEPSGGELITEPWLDKPSEARVGVPSVRPGSSSAHPALDAAIPRPPPMPSGTSPWATEAEAAIDMSALPSAHAPVVEAPPAPIQAPPPPPAEPSSGSRSWVTIFLVMALVASSATFLILRFNVGQEPQTPPGTGDPIRVPTAAATAPVVTAPAVTAQPAPTDPSLSAPSASAATDPPEAESAAPSASAAPSGTPVVVPTVTVGASPEPGSTSGPATQTSKPPSGPRPTKKPIRIF